MTPSRQEAREAVESVRLKGYLGQQFGTYDTKSIRVLIALARAYEKGELVERCDMGKVEEKEVADGT